jgi:hypothetical protein
MKFLLKEIADRRRQDGSHQAGPDPEAQTGAVSLPLLPFRRAKPISNLVQGNGRFRNHLGRSNHEPVGSRLSSKRLKTGECRFI